jgi:hypothetical protein
MNSLAKLIASIAALITALSFAWLVLAATGTVNRGVTVYHNGSVELTTTMGGFELSSGPVGFTVNHH